MAAGDYEVSATWLNGNDREAAVTYVVRDGAGGSILGSSIVDQSRAPAGSVFGRRPFEVLDTYTITGNTLVVELSTAGSLMAVIADAVRVELKSSRRTGLRVRVSRVMDCVERVC